MVCGTKNSNYPVNWDTHKKRTPCRSVGEELQICTNIAICKKCRNADACIRRKNSTPFMPSSLCLHCMFFVIANVTFFCYVWPWIISVSICERVWSFFIIIHRHLHVIQGFFSQINNAEISMKNRVSHKEKSRKLTHKSERRWALKVT